VDDGREEWHIGKSVHLHGEAGKWTVLLEEMETALEYEQLEQME